MVIYTHYKRAHLPKSKGGTKPDPEVPGFQMPNMQTDTSGDASVRSATGVQHAIDDDNLRNSQLSV